MLALLSTLKLRLAIPDTDTAQDTLLSSALQAVSTRFDKETNRTLARTVDFTQEFDHHDTEILAICYPIESVSKFETKTSETSGWQEIQPIPDYLIRSFCIISLPSPLHFSIQPLALSLARVTYAGGFLLPGDPDPQPSPLNSQPVRLPADLEQAAIEQVSYWYQNRDTLGLKTLWPRDNAYKQFVQIPLLLSVQSVLNTYTRWSL